MRGARSQLLGVPDDAEHLLPAVPLQDADGKVLGAQRAARADGQRGQRPDRDATAQDQHADDGE